MFTLLLLSIFIPSLFLLIFRSFYISSILISSHASFTISFDISVFLSIFTLSTNSIWGTYGSPRDPSLLFDKRQNKFLKLRFLILWMKLKSNPFVRVRHINSSIHNRIDFPRCLHFSIFGNLRHRQ